MSVTLFKKIWRCLQETYFFLHRYGYTLAQKNISVFILQSTLEKKSFKFFQYRYLFSWISCYDICCFKNNIYWIMYYFSCRMLEINTFYGLPVISLLFVSGFFITGIWILKWRLHLWTEKFTHCEFHLPRISVENLDVNNLNGNK